MRGTELTVHLDDSVELLLVIIPRLDLALDYWWQDLQEDIGMERKSSKSSEM